MARSQFPSSIRLNIFQYIEPYVNKSVSLYILHAPVLIYSQEPVLNSLKQYGEIISGATISQTNAFQAWEILCEKMLKVAEYFSITVNTFTFTLTVTSLDIVNSFVF